MLGLSGWLFPGNAEPKTRRRNISRHHDRSVQGWLRADGQRPLKNSTAGSKKQQAEKRCHQRGTRDGRPTAPQRVAESAVVESDLVTLEAPQGQIASAQPARERHAFSQR
tara:strand:+ start:616 stop:945 length:330 start_codon:yes stop_codon:yes gene_type:complete